LIVESTEALTGTFNGLPDGAGLLIGGRKFQIHYSSNGVALGAKHRLAASSQVILVALAEATAPTATTTTLTVSATAVAVGATVPGPGGPPDVHVYDGKTGNELRRFFAFGQGFLGGLYLAAGDVNADGFSDIVVGADAGGGANVAIFDGQTTATGQPINLLVNFFPYGQAFT